MSIIIASCTNMLFGMPCTIIASGNTFGCVNPGFWNSSNDNTRPTADCTLPLGAGWDGLTFDVDIVEVVGEAVPVAGAVWAGTVVADAPAVGALLVSVDVLGCATAAGLVAVGSELGTVVGVCTVAGKDWVVWTDVAETGLAGLVGLSIDFLQVFDVVTQGCHTG